MKINLNGKEKELTENVVFVEDLVNIFFKDKKGVIIEVNGKLISKEHGKEMRLKEGDKVEVIQFMGGG